MKRILPVILAAIGLTSCILPKKSYDYRSFLLIYHSDTRGYYQPCG